MTLKVLSTSLIIALMLGVTARAEVGFNRDVRPIMSDTCFHCHGPDKNARMAGLRLDIREEALRPTKSGRIPLFPASRKRARLSGASFRMTRR